MHRKKFNHRVESHGIEKLPNQVPRSLLESIVRRRMSAIKYAY